MTIATWERDRCPKCGDTQGADLDPTLRLCFKCRHEWNPGTTTGPIGTLDADVPASVSEYVANPAPLPSVDPWAEQLAQARSQYLGADVIAHDLEAEGTVTEITDDGYAVVTFGSGFYVELLPNEFSVTTAPAIPDETITAIATTDLAVTAQVLRAAAQTVETHGDERRLTLPPEGWLPDDADAMPVIEHGAAYAVAYLATQYGVATEDLLSMADMLDEAATAAKGAITE